MNPRLWFVFGTLCACGVLGDDMRATACAPPAIPPNIMFDQRLEPLAHRMLEQSPTFREQCRYLGAVGVLRVTVLVQVVTARSGAPPCRAQAHLQRYQYGRIEAVVRLPSRQHAAELISHELEHVREYVEGARFAALAVRSGSGVWDAGNGHYETARATAVGRRVAAELEARRTH